MSTSSIRRTLVKLLDRRIPRRLVTIPATVLLAVLAVALAPLTVIGAMVLDRGRPWQRLRLVALITGGLIIEVLGMIGGLVMWIVTGFGLARSRRWTWHAHRWLMGRYAASLLALIVRVLGTHIEWRTPTDLRGPVIVLARHTSFFDALIPVTVLSRHNRLLAHHVLTAGLRYLPNLDLVGHRFPNRFVSRTPGRGSAELGHIAAVGAVLDERSGAIIFPEGTFRSETRFDRALRRLRRRHPDLAEIAGRFDHVLPPRSAGTHALVEGAPDNVTVMICANTGLEAFSTLAEIRASLVAPRPIVVETWNVKSADIPTDADAFLAWLIDQYQRIDDWVAAEIAERSR